MAQLHTSTHILNALVFQEFQGALVTGAQLNADGTARLDFDLPDADNDRLRGPLETAITTWSARTFLCVTSTCPRTRPPPNPA
jgi:Ser-tRNA(Ala) deacylase AlaX